MTSLELAGGSLRVTYPDTFTVQPPRRPPAGRGGRAAGPSVWAETVGPTSEVSASLLEAFASQDLELVEPFELVPAGPTDPADPDGPAGQIAPGGRLAPGERQGRPPARAGKVHVELEVPQGRDAVILLEQDGLFSWQMPTGPRTPPRRPRRPAPAKEPAASRRQGQDEPPGSIVRFEIDVRPALPARSSARVRPALGPFGDVAIGRLKAYVLSFPSRLVPGAIMSFLERGTRPGLVLMTGKDVKSWTRVDNLSQVRLPANRPARILLFIHGTFQSTAGSFGVLTATGPGQKMLKAAASSYDAVIGFDHRTLSRDPLENATDLHARLSARHLEHAPAIDLVSYSRGGLVARSLVEYVLPSSTTWPADIGKVVFVGATNAGTQLAEPENWKTLADLYTNLAAGTARSIGFATGVAPAAEIVGGLVAGIGAFVKYLVSAATLTGMRIPGLAAMEPDGPFVNGINATQPGQPAPGTPWYVVSSDFEPALFDGRHEPPELPRALVAKLADGLVDNLMGTTNDLVVDTASMSSVDLPSGGGFIKDSLAFGTNGVVYHLNYFIQPRVCRALTDWLEIR
jgi:hypothetical protein